MTNTRTVMIPKIQRVLIPSTFEQSLLPSDVGIQTLPGILACVALMISPECELRIPVKATTLSGAWRPRDPVDDDQGGARA